MVNTIETTFVRAFESEVHSIYQRQGSKLRNTVRTRNNVKGSSTTFQVVGKGVASTKARNGQVPVMNVNHTAKEISLSDYYAGDWIDKLDELKMNHDEKTVVANAGAYALGRKTDELLIDALKNDSTIESVISSQQGYKITEGLTKAKVLAAFEKMGQNDVPDDGNRTAIVGWKQWSDLMALTEFANADYVGDKNLPWQGTQAKHWLGTLWLPHSGLPKSGDARTCFWYHKNALAHASGSNVQSDITWHGERAAFFVNNMMSQGAGVVDASGIVKFECKE